MGFDLVALIAYLNIGVSEHLGHEKNFPMKWWEKKLLKYLIKRRHLATPLAYAVKKAYEDPENIPTQTLLSDRDTHPSGWYW